MPEELVPFVWFAAIIAAVVVFVILYLVVGSFIGRRRRARYIAALLDEFHAWERDVDRAGGFASADYGIQLPEGEECFFAAAATLKEPRAVRVTQHSGYGVRPARRIGVFEGESRSESHDEWRAISSGVLYLTNRRVIFAGEKQNRTVKLADMFSFDAFVDALEVHASSRSKSMRFTGLNGNIANKVLLFLTQKRK